MNILLSLFTRKSEGTYYRAWPWAQGLVESGHRVTIACVSPSRRLGVHRTYDRGVRILETPNLLDGRRSFRKLCGMSGWGPFDTMHRVREIKRGAYDVVHLFEHHLNVSLPVYLATSGLAPLVVSDWCDHYGRGGFRDNAPRPRLQTVYRRLGAPVRAGMDFLERDLRLRSHGVTVISRYLRQRAVSLGVPSERIALIPGSADVAGIRPLPRPRARLEAGIDPHAPVVAFFGAALLDLDLLLRAFAHVLQTRPAARLLLIGRTTQPAEQRIRAAGLDDRVMRTGWVEEDRLAVWLACADLFVLPMTDTPVNRARWPNKIGFHMAAARPTVCVAVGDVADLVHREKIGLVCRPDPKEFAAAMLRLLGDAAARDAMGARARRVAEEQFDVRLHVRALQQAYMCFATGCAMESPLTEPSDGSWRGGTG